MTFFDFKDRSYKALKLAIKALKYIVLKISYLYDIFYTHFSELF